MHVGSAAAGTLVSSLGKHAGQIQLSNKLQANGGWTLPFGHHDGLKLGVPAQVGEADRW